MSDVASHEAGGKAVDDDRWLPVRVLAVALALVACGLGAARLLQTSMLKAPPLIDPASPLARTGGPRIAAFAEAIPKIAARDEQAAFVYGGSLAFFGFSPELFDTRLREHGVTITSYTSATIWMGLEVEMLLAKRIDSAFKARHRRVALSLVEFTPHGLTIASSECGPIRKAEQRATEILTKEPPLVDVAWDDPDEAARIVGETALGGHDEDALSDALGRFATKPPDEWFPARRRRARGKPRPSAAWNFDLRGEARLLWPGMEEGYQNALEKFNAMKPKQKVRLIAHNDAVGLHFDDDALDDFVKLVKILQATSDRTYIWLAPRNRDLLSPTPEAYDRLHAALRRVAQATNAPIIDLFAMPDITDADFADMTHLNEHSGKKKFTPAFADCVFEQIERDEARKRDSSLSRSACSSY